MTEAANYSARRAVVDGVEVAELADAAHRVEVSIAPSLGNQAYRIAVNGKNILWWPYRSLAEMRAQPQFCAVPFLAPWANRLDEDGFWANGKHYVLNPSLGNVRRDGQQRPIHGLLSESSAWELVEVATNGEAAWATSRLEFSKQPDLMAQFPFAHTITMTYRLSRGAVEVVTTLDNHAAEPMPVAIGFHPYFRLHDSPRDQWRVHLAARDHLTIDKRLIPTGERTPVAFADPHPLAKGPVDDVFSNLVRDADGLARFWVEGQHERITVVYGPKYPVAIVYTPQASEFICFEPMAAITNALNLAHSGVYRELQSIPPGGQWRESFWIVPSGF